MKAIITGITGQDGSHLADLLLSKGYEVIGISRRCSVDNTQRIQHLVGDPKFKLVSGDITDVHSLLKVFQNNEDVDEVYNLAAQSHVAVSFKQPGLTWDITGKGCLNVLQTIVDLELGCKFYQASSSEMFGDSYDVDAHGNKYQDENTKFLPQSPYAIAKCAAHYVTRLFRESHGLHASTGILFNHEGERRGENFVTRKITKWIGQFMSWCEAHGVGPEQLVNCTDEVYIGGRISRGQGFQFPKLRLGNLEAFRDWGYAADYVEAMWLMLQQEEPDDYVVCTGETHTIKDLLNYAFEIAGIENWESLVTIDPEFYRPAEVDYLRGRSLRVQEKLGWTPAHSFKDLVKLMVEHDLDANIQSTS